jgi:hypothetical protein
MKPCGLILRSALRQKRYEGMRLRPSIVSSLPDPTLSFTSSNTSNPIPATTHKDARTWNDEDSPVG